MITVCNKLPLPCSDQYRPDPDYLRHLLDGIGLSQRAVARHLGISERTFRRYLTATDNATYQPAPYVVQFALEVWASPK